MNLKTSNMTKIIKKHSSYFILIIILFVSCKPTAIYKDASKPIEERIENLLSLMTLDEKIALLGGNDSLGFGVIDNKRLGIPALKFTDGPAGPRFEKAISYPAPIVYAASWDTALVNKIGVAFALDTKAQGRNALLGPCVNIHRFPLGGRNFESFGEDPFLAGRIAVSYIKGVQSENVIACVKHFAANNQELDRQTVDVSLDERSLREIYTPAFFDAVTEGGVWSVMTAYNRLNGKYCSENNHIISDILKNEWQFKGYVISDWSSMHSVTGPVRAGMDLEMPKSVFFTKDSLVKALQSGAVTEQMIDDKVRRLLRVRFLAGLFDEQSKPNTTDFENHEKLALKIAEQGMVLLKNERNILPLDKTKIESIAVIGQSASDVITGGGGSASVFPVYKISPLNGIKAKVGDNIKVEFTPGYYYDSIHLFVTESDMLFTPDGKPGLLGSYYQNKEFSGTPAFSRVDRSLNFKFETQVPVGKLNAENLGIRWVGKVIPKQSGTYIFQLSSDDGVRLFINNKLVVEEWKSRSAAYDSYEMKLEAGKPYDFKIEYYNGLYGGSMKFDVALKENTNNELQAAVALAKRSDVAIVFAGIPENMEGEGNDRQSFNLPDEQTALIQAVTRANPNTIVVVNTGTAFKVSDWISNTAALIDMFYCGGETGNAIANILFGDANPSGKMPFSLIKDVSQTTVFQNYRSTNQKISYSEGLYVGYRNLDKNNLLPSFPFGFGLSYTTFEISNIRTTEGKNHQYQVSVDVENTGKRDGAEVVQLYVSDVQCSVDRPVKELKAFSKVMLKAGETKTVTMNLNERAFAFYDIKSKGWKVEPGEFRLLVGNSSKDLKLVSTIYIK